LVGKSSFGDRTLDCGVAIEQFAHVFSKFLSALARASTQRVERFLTYAGADALGSPGRIN